MNNNIKLDHQEIKINSNHLYGLPSFNVYFKTKDNGSTELQWKINKKTSYNKLQEKPNKIEKEIHNLKTMINRNTLHNKTQVLLGIKKMKKLLLSLHTPISK